MGGVGRQWQGRANRGQPRGGCHATTAASAREAGYGDGGFAREMA